MSAAVQLAMPGIDALADDLTPAEVVAVEAAIRQQEAARARRATYAPTCRCDAGWTDDRETCAKCGRRLA